MRVHMISAGLGNYSRGPWPGMAEGDTLPNPVAAPEHGQENVSAMEKANLAGTLRDRDADGHLVYGDAAPRFEDFEAGTPPPLRPLGSFDRVRRHPLTSFSTREEAGHRVLNLHQDVGSHGEIEYELSDQHSGGMQPNHQVLRSTFRLAPEPWSSSLWLDQDQ